MTLQRAKYIAKQCLKWLNWTLVLPLLVLLGLTGVMLYTPPGLHLSLWLAEAAVDGLNIERSQGSVLGGNTLYNVRYQQQGMELVLQQAELTFNNGCFFKLAICVDKLGLNGIQLTMPATEPEPETTVTAVPMSPLWLPVPITITQLQLNDAQLDIMGNQLNWHSFNTAIYVWGNKLQLTQPQWQQVILHLADNSNTDTGNTSFAYQPPTLPDFSLPLSLFVDGFELTDFTIQQQTEQQHISKLALSLQWQKQQLDILQLDIHHSQANLHASAKVTTAQDYPLQTQLELTVINGDFNQQQLRLNASGNLAALQLDITALGPVSATLNASLNLLDAKLPHQLDISSDNLQWPLSATEPDISLSRTQLSFAGDLQRSDFSGRASINAVQIPSAATEFTGFVGLNGITLDKLLIDTLSGQIQTTASANWQHNLQWQGVTKLNNIQPGTFWPDYAGQLQGELSYKGTLNDNNSWQLNLERINLNGRLRDYALALDGKLTVADTSGNGDIELNTLGLKLNHADNSVAIAGKLQQDWQLSVLIDIPKLEQSINDAKGSLDGRFTVTGARALPRLNGEIIAKQMHWQQFDLEQLTLNSVLWLDDAKKLNTKLSLSANNASFAEQKIAKISLSLDGSERKHQLNFALNSNDYNAQLTLNGGLSDDQQQWQGQLTQAELSSMLGTWQLAQATTMQVSIPKQQFVMAPHCWQQQDSSVCLSKNLTANSKNIQLNLDVNQFNLATLTAFMPSQFSIEGALDATLAANWQLGNLPEATLNISSNSGKLTQQVNSPMAISWHQLTLQSTLSGDVLKNTLAINFTDDTSLNAELQVSELQSAGNKLQGHVKLQQFALDILQPLLGELNEFNGQLSSNLAIAGSLQQPLLNGEIALSKIRVKGKKAPIDVDDAEISLNFADQQAQLLGLVKTPNGEINISGDASWQQLIDWQAVIRIKGDELQLQVPQARLKVAPDLTLHASPELTRLTGSVTIPSANISIDSLPQNAVEISDDLVLLDKQLKPLPFEEKSTFLFQTDINVVLGNKVKLSAFGLKTLLKGNLRVRQQPQQALVLNGEVVLQDGTFRAYGQDLLIRKGKMSFNGPADQPFLNIEAIRNPANMEDDVIAGIRVNGPADEPSVVIFSEPAKAQANALAYLLMGRDLDSTSGDTGNAVTTSLIGMTLSSSSKVVGELGEAFGLRDLTLDTAGAGDNSQVTVSGYLSRDLQLKYGYGIFNALGEFTLRYRLMRSLYLEAVTGVNDTVDLLYKFEFN